MTKADQVGHKIDWLAQMKADLELAERLNEQRGLDFSEDEKEMLKVLRQRLPGIQALFEKVLR